MRKRILFEIYIFLIAMLYLPTIAFTETIILKSGKTIEGNVIEKTDKYIKVNSQGIPLTYFYDEIKSIEGAKPNLSSIEKNLLLKNEQEVVERGFGYAKAGRSQEAISEFQNVLRSDPDNSEAHRGLGIELNAIGRYEESISHLKKSLEINPNFSGAYNTYAVIGIAYFYLGQQREAINYYKKAIEIKPDYEAYSGIAFCYQALKQPQEAIEYFKKAIEIKPNDENIYVGLGDVYMNLGKYKEARENLLRAKELAQRSGNSQLIQEIDKGLSKIP